MAAICKRKPAGKTDPGRLFKRNVTMTEISTLIADPSASM